MNLSLLTALWKARTLKVSKPGEWVTPESLSELYNNTYSIPLVNKLTLEGGMTATRTKRVLQRTILSPLHLQKALHKIYMDPRRMEEILKNLVREGCYITDAEKGYRFMTRNPKKKR